MEINYKKYIILTIVFIGLLILPGNICYEQPQDSIKQTRNNSIKMVKSCERYIANNEGLRLELYYCSAGIATIGYGRNLVNTGVNKEEAQLMLENDINKAIAVLYNIFTFDEVKSWSNHMQIAMVDMIFNLGGHGFKRFKKMITAIKAKEFELAANELLDSHYARQVPNRANRNADRIRENVQ